MNKGINYAYQELETAIVNQINKSGLPIFAVRDMLNRLLLQVDKQTADQIEMEKKAYFDGLEAEKKSAQSAEPEAATAEAAPAGKEEPHA